MKKILTVIILCASLASISACSSNQDSKSSNEDRAASSSTEIAQKNVQSMKGNSNPAADTQNQADAAQKFQQRKVIYTANLVIEVKDYRKMLGALEQRAKDFGGYIVQSAIHKQQSDQLRGEMTFRVPQEKFQAFLDYTENGAAKVEERNVSGQDVTEEYVDITARLKAKKVVEARLLSFMEKADKTEDLLKISDDLARVQEEIESIEGRKKYLENQSELATVNITMVENKISIPDIEKDNGSLWLKIKKQFITSTNIMLKILSSLLVFVLGNILIFLIIALALIPIYLYIKKKIQQ
ncbi:DUF4349 domain-containing protein [Falsibacillus albus]|uniref:DUF4349 domain-containing protein n=1 Tax=Falsibacillus albus TaxID=2478915 RepID=A0A3L7K1R7_9BACI|nr:DUF4349 domain-containing protein [Falsibacillus albus]RLQ95921.1 DUF4349 domain-containing protein [Falsibacillus albus]